MKIVYGYVSEPENEIVLRMDVDMLELMRGMLETKIEASYKEKRPIKETHALLECWYLIDDLINKKKEEEQENDTI